ncbi:serine hydrolase domain-containing protein [Halococcus agarilyticus]|uniref:serine hydrolase domain-containing protein n=1 Tax=Halococcus agarilyticus TaxID=1232219 RepID=UPI00067780BB|nr:serine hydrolase domain-containing protein [Halococcus agarilyticus]
MADTSLPETTPARTDSVLDELLAEGVEAGIFTGAAAAVGTSRGIERRMTAGTCDPETEAPITRATLFDAASTTKAVVTATVVLRLVEEGVLALSAPLEAYVPPLGDTERGRLSLRHLMTHTSGLQPYYYDPDWDGAETAREAIYDAELMEANPGERFAYSCLNFVHLADAARRATDSTLEALAGRFVFEPAGMDAARIGPVGDDVPLAATYEREHADRALAGEIHDPIARALGGESGNAGLFTTATDLGRFAATLLSDGRRDTDEPRLLAPGTINRMCENWTSEFDRPHGLGWRFARECYPAPNWSRDSFGHTGYTGTSVWLDPTADRFAVLLTNEVYCGKEAGMARFRERFHGAVASERY